MLTTNQQQILASLQEEFLKMNKTPSVNKLIPLDEIMKEREEDMVLRRSIEITNAQYENNRKGAIANDIARLQAELNGTKLKVYDLGDRIKIAADKHDDGVGIRYNMESKYTYFESRIEPIITIKGQLNLSFYNEYDSLRHFNTLDELVGSADFIRKLKAIL